MTSPTHIIYQSSSNRCSFSSECTIHCTVYNVNNQKTAVVSSKATWFTTDQHANYFERYSFKLSLPPCNLLVGQITTQSEKNVQENMYQFNFHH
jgi:hypothetical protein